MLTVYGIPNCDTCRKARKWLESRGHDYTFHDLRIDGLSRRMLERWLQACDWPSLLNKRSTTWRAIPAAERQNIDRNQAIALMLANPTLVKRPVLESGAIVCVGFAPARYQEITR